MEWKFKDNSIEIGELLDEAGREWLEDASRVLHRQVVQNTRVDTGQTKGSWRKAVDGNKAIVGSTSINAVYEEFGTGHYAVSGNGRPTAWYVLADGYTGNKKPTYNGKVVRVYGKDGKTYYKTNGKKPTRALGNAFNTSRPKIEKRLEQIFKEKLE